MRANQGHAFTSTVGPAQMVPVGLARLPQDDTTDLTANDFTGKDLHGKIALIQRGTITFEKKINNAAAAGAIGALVYDNVPEVSLLHMATASATLPSMSISQADGQALVSFLQSLSECTGHFRSISDCGGRNAQSSRRLQFPWVRGEL